MVGFVFLDILNYALDLTFTVRKCGIGNTGVVVFYPHSVPTGLPTSRPYGTPENNGAVSTHIPSLRDYLHRGPTGLPIFRPYGSPGNTGVVGFYPYSVPTGLPTSRPYGTPENNGAGVFYLPRVPAGLPISRPYGSTHIASLRDFGKFRGRCFLPFRQ